MTTFVHSYSSRHVLCFDHKEYENIRQLKHHLNETQGVPIESCFLICNGALVDDDEPVQENVVYHTYLKILGGKGGFGSMLRAIGAQIEKTTNHEACRDLSGRRMRDVNYEKDLKEWLAKKAEKDREKEQRRQDRLARRRAMPNHKFDDPLYLKQRELVSENQDDAIQKGLQKMTAGSSGSTASSKRKAETVTSSTVTSKKKKGTEWLGVDMDLSDLDSDEGSDSSSDSTGPSSSGEQPGPSATDTPSPTGTSTNTSTHDKPSLSNLAGDTQGASETSVNIPIDVKPSLSTLAADTSGTPTDKSTETLEDVKTLDGHSEEIVEVNTNCTKSASQVNDVKESDKQCESLSDSQESRSTPEVKTDATPEVKTEATSEVKTEAKADDVKKEYIGEESRTTPEVKTETIAVKKEFIDETEKTNEAEIIPHSEPFCFEERTSMEDVLCLGMDGLKEELMRRGLKCGGTLQQRAQRLFSVKGLPVEDIDPSLFAKSNGKNGKKKK